MARAPAAELARSTSAAGDDGLSKAGWGQTLLRVKRQVSQDNLSIVAAGVAFYFLLAVFPALTAMVSLYGLVFEAQQVSEQISRLSAFLPGQAVELLTGQLGELANSNRSALGLGVAGGLLLTLWSSSVGVRKLMDALNLAYDETEKRSFLHRTALALLLTLGAILLGVVAIATIVLLPAVDRFLGSDNLLQTAIGILRWPLVALLFALALGVLYRFGPSREHARWKWVSWGAGVATLLWVVGSALFSWYVSNFGSYNKSYGSMGAVVILLMWFLLCAFVTLIGAELDSELARQNRKRPVEDT